MDGKTKRQVSKDERRELSREDRKYLSENPPSPTPFFDNEKVNDAAD